MKLISLPVIVILLIVTFTVTGRELIASYQPKIDVLSDVDVCDSVAKTRLFFRVNIGPVKRSDSLFGFDIKIKYDPKKLKIINYYTGNTLSEFFEEKGFSFGLDSNGLISGYCVTFKFDVTPPSGDSILVAFGAEWLGNCEDTTYLQIVDLNFTEEFKKVLSDTLGGGLVKAYSFEKPNRIAGIFAESNQIQLKDNQTDINLKYNVSLPQNYYNNTIQLKFNAENNIDIYDVSSSSNDVELNLNGNEIGIILKNKVKNFDLNLKCNYSIGDTVTNYLFYIDKVLLPDCSCILGTNSDTVKITKDSTFVSVKEEIAEYIRQDENSITIKNDDLHINKVVVFDLLGSKLYEIEPINKTEIKIFTEDFTRSVFFVLIYKETKIEIKKFYKCYLNKFRSL